MEVHEMSSPDEKVRRRRRMIQKRKAARQRDYHSPRARWNAKGRQADWMRHIEYE